MDRSRGDNIQEILVAIDPEGQNRALGRVPRNNFFCPVNETRTNFHQIWPRNVNPVPSKRMYGIATGVGKYDIFENIKISKISKVS